MFKLKDIEQHIAKGQILNRNGNWCSIDDAIAEENDYIKHLENGEILSNGKWISLSEIETDVSEAEQLKFEQEKDIPQVQAKKDDEDREAVSGNVISQKIEESSMLQFDNSSESEGTETKDILGVESDISDAKDIQTVESDIWETKDIPSVESDVSETKDIPSVESDVSETKDIPSVEPDNPEEKDIADVESDVSETKDITSIESDILETRIITSDEAEARDYVSHGGKTKLLRLLDNITKKSKQEEKDLTNDKVDKDIEQAPPVKIKKSSLLSETKKEDAKKDSHKKEEAQARETERHKPKTIETQSDKKPASKQSSDPDKKKTDSLSDNTGSGIMVFSKNEAVDEWDRARSKTGKVILVISAISIIIAGIILFILKFVL